MKNLTYLKQILWFIAPASFITLAACNPPHWTLKGPIAAPVQSSQTSANQPPAGPNQEGPGPSHPGPVVTPTPGTTTPEPSVPGTPTPGQGAIKPVPGSQNPVPAPGTTPASESPELAKLKKQYKSVLIYESFLNASLKSVEETMKDYMGEEPDSDLMNPHLSCSLLSLELKVVALDGAFIMAKPVMNIILRSSVLKMAAKGTLPIGTALVLSKSGRLLKIIPSKAVAKTLDMVKWQTAVLMTAAGATAIVHEVIPGHIEKPEMPNESADQDTQDFVTLGYSNENAELMSSAFRFKGSNEEQDAQAFQSIQKVVEETADENAEPVGFFHNLISGCSAESKRLDKQYGIFQAAMVKTEEYRIHLDQLIKGNSK